MASTCRAFCISGCHLCWLLFACCRQLCKKWSRSLQRYRLHFLSQSHSLIFLLVPRIAHCVWRIIVYWFFDFVCFFHKEMEAHLWSCAFWFNQLFFFLLEWFCLALIIGLNTYMYINDWFWLWQLTRKSWAGVAPVATVMVSFERSHAHDRECVLPKKKTQTKVLYYLVLWITLLSLIDTCPGS